MKKIKITEGQLKRLVENKGKNINESVKETEEKVQQTEKKEVVNESVEKIKSEFKRFL
jgi:hypothetical protein